MFIAVVFLSFLFSISAFSPNGQIRSTRVSNSVLTMRDFSNELGVTKPLGFYDPLGLLKDGDEDKYNRLRKVEIKHGRISMLAILGHIVTAAGVRLPGEIAYGVPFKDVHGGLKAFENIPTEGWLQIVAFIGLIEWGFSTIEEPLAIYFDEEVMPKQPAMWKPDKIKSKKNIEINNGRAAMMGILGLMVHEKLDGNAYVLNSLLGLDTVTL